MNKTMILAASGAGLLLLGGISGFAIGRSGKKRVIPVTSPSDMQPSDSTAKLTVETLEEIVKPASELVSQKYYYKNASTYEKTGKSDLFKKLTTEQIVFTYEGTIGGGIDLSAVQFAVDEENKTVNVTLPAPHITSNEIDMNSFVYFDAKKSIFTEIKPEDVTTNIGKLQQDAEDEIVNDEHFLQQVNENAKNILTSILTMSDQVQDYQITFVDSIQETPTESES